MELAVLLEPLDGHDRPAVRLDGEDRARLHRPAVEEHRAGAAVGRVAPDVGPGEAEHLPDQVDQEQPGLDVGVAPLAVDRDAHAHPDLLRSSRPIVTGREPTPPPRRRAAVQCAVPARSSARRIARAVRTRTRSRLYATDPRRSSDGSLSSAAACAASRIVASSSRRPCRAAPPRAAP